MHHIHNTHHLATLAASFRKLDRRARLLVLSFKLMNVSDVVMQVFVNTFIWRQFERLEYSALYNLLFFTGLLVGVYLNNVLLHRHRLGLSYALSTALVGLLTFGILLFPPTVLWTLGLVGLALGTVYGMYWGNRHMMVLEVTTDGQRNYFNGVLGSIGALLGVVLPFVIGWWLATAPRVWSLSLTSAYLVLGVVALLVAVSAGAVVFSLPFTRTTPSRFRFRFRSPSRVWSLYRACALVWGFSRGVNWFLPALLLLTFFNGEGPVGYVLSLRALLLMIMLYSIGTHVSRHTRQKPAEWGVGVVCGDCADLVHVSQSRDGPDVRVWGWVCDLLGARGIQSGLVRCSRTRRCAQGGRDGVHFRP